MANLVVGGKGTAKRDALLANDARVLGDESLSSRALTRRAQLKFDSGDFGAAAQDLGNALEAAIEAYSAEQGIERRALSPDQIVTRLMAVLANEGARIVEEAVAESDAAVDVVQMHGYGFPRWRGGPMQHANETGWEETARIMQEVAAESPNSWTLAGKVT